MNNRDTNNLELIKNSIDKAFKSGFECGFIGGVTLGVFITTIIFKLIR